MQNSLLDIELYALEISIRGSYKATTEEILWL